MHNGIETIETGLNFTHHLSNRYWIPEVNGESVPPARSTDRSLTGLLIAIENHDLTAQLLTRVANGTTDMPRSTRHCYYPALETPEFR
jgi:hypothetical protein